MHDNALSTLNLQKYNVVPKDLGEVIPTSNVAFIPVEQGKGIAFGFHIDDIQKGRCKPGGMANAFGVKCCSDLGDQFRKLN